MALRPQPGAQEQVLACSADIAFIGGSAGGGKTFLLELEPCRHYNNKDFGATYFRRTTKQITAQGGLWDTSKKIYPQLNARPKESTLEWIFPSGANVKFTHLEHEKDVISYQGAQIPLIIFDELTHFTEYMFWYMVQRNRTSCGVRPYLRASCNPDPLSWVATFIEWWIDQNTGFPIKERSGVIRYFTRDGDIIVWGDTKQEVIDKCPHIFHQQRLIDTEVETEHFVKSFTFISMNIFDNKIFIKEDPGYLGNLLSLPAEERARFLDGNWRVSLDGLMLCEHAKIEQIYDNWPEKDPNPGRYIICDAARFGRDFAVIQVWKGWECIYMVVYKISDAHDLNGKIEQLRARFSVSRDDVVVDADGVGDGTIKLGGYVPFHGGAAPEPEPDSKYEKFRYFNLKTQCHYRFAQKRINTGQVRYSWNNETVEIHDGSAKNGILSTRIKVGTQIKDVRDMHKEDLRTWKRKETPNEGTDKKQMMSKEEQKNILKRSPDFGDCSAMREYIELRPKRRTMQREN